MSTKQLTQSELNEALLNAAEKGEIAKVKEFLSKGADINAKDINGYTTLIYPILTNHLNTIEFLIKNAADVNAKDNYGNTLLILAVMKNSPETVELLIQNGADPTLKNNAGETAEDVARLEGYIELAEILKNVIEESKRICDAFIRKDLLTMSDGKFLDSLEAGLYST